MEIEKRNQGVSGLEGSQCERSARLRLLFLRSNGAAGEARVGRWRMAAGLDDDLDHGTAGDR